MLFSGSEHFQFPNQKELSFNLNLDNLNADFSFGFSGDNDNLEFKIIDRNIFDFKNFLVYTIPSGDSINISGDLNLSGYSYYINKNPIFLNQTRNSFDINKFYYNIDGNSIINGSIDIFGEQPSYYFQFPSTFISGQNISGKIINNQSNQSFTILDVSGEYYNKNITQVPLKKPIIFISKYTGSLQPLQTGDFVIQTSGSEFRGLNNAFDLYIKTNFGEIYTGFNSSIFGQEYIFNFSSYLLVDNFNSSRDLYSANQTRTDSVILDYVSYSRDNNGNIYYSKPLDISLFYDSGITGSINTKIPASGYNNVNYTGFLYGSGYLNASGTGIGTGINLISNIIETGFISQSFAKNTLDFLSGNIFQDITIDLSGYSSGELIVPERFLGTGNLISLTFSNPNVSGLDYISGTALNIIASGKYNNTIYSGKISETTFITGAYFTGIFNKDLYDIIGSGYVTGYANSIFTGISYANNIGSGFIIGSGALTGTNINVIATGNISGDINKTQHIKNINTTIYGYKVATGIRNLNLELTGYGLCTGNYKGTNFYGNFISGTGLNNFSVSGYIAGTGFLTGYGIGFLYDKYGSSGTGFYTGFKYYDSANEKVIISNAGLNNVNGIYLKSGLYNYGSGNSNIKWSSNSGWVILNNNTPIYGSLSNSQTPVEASNWFSYPGYSQVPIVSGQKEDYINFNYNIIATGTGIVTGINNNFVDIFSNNINKNYSLNITGSGEYIFSEQESISGTGLLDVFNNFDFNLSSYPVTGVILANTITSGIQYFTGSSSGVVPLLISGTGSLTTTFGLPTITTLTGIYYSGYNQTFLINDSGIKNLSLPQVITTGDLAIDYINIPIPPNLYFSNWQSDSSSFTNTNSPNGQYIYVNNLNLFGANVATSGYIGDYHYIIYNNTSGWQIRRKNSNSYGWSGLNTNSIFPTVGWTGFGLSASRVPGIISKIGFSHLGLRSIDPALSGRFAWNLSEIFQNINSGITITGSGVVNFNTNVNYSGKLISGSANLPILGNITGSSTVYITGYEKQLSNLTGGFLENKISVFDGAVYNSSSVSGVGLLSTTIVKTGFYEDTAISLPTTGYIYSQVEFPYSGAIDTYSGYLNNNSSRLLSTVSLTINNNLGYITTGVNLRQDANIAQDNLGRIKNLLPLELYPITDYSGNENYIVYATGYFIENITGFFNLEKSMSESGTFLCSGELNGSVPIIYNDINSGNRFISQEVTGIFINPKIFNSDIVVTGSSNATGFIDRLVASTGLVSKTIDFYPIITFSEGMAVTGAGVMLKTLDRNVLFNVTSGIANYANPYIENIYGYSFTGYIDPFIATGNKSITENQLITGLINSTYAKTFANSFSIKTGYVSNSNALGMTQLDLISNTKYGSSSNILSGVEKIFIRIEKVNHYNNDLIYATLSISGKDAYNNTSVIQKAITGGL